MKARIFDQLSFGSLAVLVAMASAATAQNIPRAPVPAGAGANAQTSEAAAASADPVGLPMSPAELVQYDLDHYEKIREKSPFSFKIVKQEGPPPESFAKDLALAGFSIDAGKGVTYASIVDKKQNTRFVINTQSPNKDGIQLVKLNRGPTLLETTVLARKGVEEATIASDKQIIERKAVAFAGAPGAAAPAARPANAPPGQPNNAPQQPPRNAIQGQINQQLRPQGPNGQPPRGGAPGGLPPGAVPANVTPQPSVTATGAPMSAGDQAAAAAGIIPQNPAAAPSGVPGANQGNRPGRGGGGNQPVRRRVILPGGN